MPIHNSDISEIFRKIADLLAIDEANEFRIRAYRQAAQSIDNLSQDISTMIAEDKDLTQLPGIGKSIAEKIEEIVETGQLKQLDQLREKVPEELRELMNLEGLGPERIKTLYHELDIKSIEDLKQALQEKKVQALEGFGEKTATKIKKSLARQSGQEKRILYKRAEEYTEPLVDYLQNASGVKQVTVAGSYRRRKETVGDIDILVTCQNQARIMDHFVAYEDVTEVTSQGKTKSSVRLRSGLQVDLRVVAKKSYGAALTYFTGSKQHNIRIRERAQKRSLKINEYGVFRENKQESIAGKTEQEVYKAIDLPWIPPELREDRGEIAAAEAERLPTLVTLDDLKGDLQMHSTASDGKESIKNMAKAAQELGHQYIAITDHSKRVTVAQGLDADRLAKQIDEIDQLNSALENFRILKAVEVDILDDGSLDLPDEILKRLDLRVCSVHYYFNLSRAKQTRRILKAMENPYFNILAHPTVRELNKREPLDMDMEKIMDTALEYGCYLEINASPRRLDLNDIHTKMAKERGLKLSISTDAHSISQLQNLKYGINQARRGWLTADDVLNTGKATDLLQLLKRD